MPELKIHRTESDGWLSNAYLVVNPDRAQGVLIDGNGEPGPLLDRIEQERIDITATFLTHHHADHIEIDAYSQFSAPIFAHADTAQLGQVPVSQSLVDREVVRTAGFEIEVLYTPGHARDHFAYLIDGVHCFTADVIFQGTVGGTRGPTGSNLTELRASVDRLLALPPETILYPGHCQQTTVAQELGSNPFVRAWRGEIPVMPQSCMVRDEPAELMLWGPDYDGTHKAWVRMRDGEEHVVGGSQVKPASDPPSWEQ
jgi:hydroxyacylglutathione hydrolase